MSVREAQEELQSTFYVGAVSSLYKRDAKQAVWLLENAIKQLNNRTLSQSIRELALAFVYREMADAHSALDDGEAVIYRVKYMKILEKYPREANEIGSQIPSPAGDPMSGGLHVRWKRA